MTDQERLDNEAIAGWFEARPTEPPSGPKQAWIATTSPKGWWQFDYRRDVWIPRHDFYTDESANAILRDAMPCIAMYHDGGVWRIRHSGGALNEDVIEDHDYKRAIVGAFKLFMAATKPEVQG